MQGTHDTATKQQGRKDKVLKMPTVFDKHPPESPGESSDKETSSGAEEPQATTTKTCRQLNLDAYPEAKKELKDLELFYTTEQNLRRRGMTLKLETWRKAKIHILSE